MSGETEINASGGVRKLEYALSPIRVSDGTIAALVVRLAEVAERGDAELGHEPPPEELREANEKLVLANLEVMSQAELVERQVAQMSTLLASLQDGVAIFDASGRVLLRNEAANGLSVLPDRLRRAALYEPESRLLDLQGRPVPKSHWPARRVLRGEQLRDFECILERADGSRRHVLHSSGTVRDKHGKVELAILVLRDVTELRRLEQAREEFASLVSHDLRSPLAALKGHAQLLQRSLRQRGLERETASAEAIVRSATRMISMIEDLVESAALESGRLEMRREPTEVVHLLTELLARVISPADQPRVTLEAPDWVPLVLADPVRLERVVTNLVTNALKYSPPDSPVAVRVEHRDGEVVVSVTDRGVGIAPEDLPYLFEKFRRARTAGNAEGFGLGLYIARPIAEAHGGRIWVDSEVQKGSTFSLALPASPG